MFSLTSSSVRISNVSTWSLTDRLVAYKPDSQPAALVETMRSTTLFLPVSQDRVKAQTTVGKTESTTALSHFCTTAFHPPRYGLHR